MIRAIIVEDEAVAARRLKQLVEAHGITVVDICDSLEELRLSLQTNKVELYFFDIQLSDGLIFEVLETVVIEEPIIFTTAYDKYAIKAFKQHSIDYLLKPIDEEDLSQAIQKFKKMQQPKPLDMQRIAALIASEHSKQNYRSRILVKIADQFKSIGLKDVSHIYSEEKSTWIAHKEGRVYPIDVPLHEIEKQLDPKSYFKINRGCIINIDHIVSIHQHSSSRLKLKVGKDNSERLAVARDRVSNFKIWMDR